MLIASAYSRSSFRIHVRSWKTASGLTSVSLASSAVLTCRYRTEEDKPTGCALESDLHLLKV
jgi:hypothetical protein